MTTSLFDLIPLPVTHNAQGNQLPPLQWVWPRSDAYEVMVTVLLPKEWVLYSHDPSADGKEYGARRTDRRARVLGQRAPGGRPQALLAEVDVLPGHRRVRRFAVADFGEALQWAEEQLNEPVM